LREWAVKGSRRWKKREGETHKMGKEGTKFWEKEQSKVLGDDRKEKGRRRMAYLKDLCEWGLM